MATIVRHGGWYVDEDLSGFTCRFMRETPTNTSESVASKYNNNSTPVTESRVLYELFKFVDMPNYGRIMYCCVYRTLKC